MAFGFDFERWMRLIPYLYIYKVILFHYSTQLSFTFRNSHFLERKGSRGREHLSKYFLPTFLFYLFSFIFFLHHVAYSVELQFSHHPNTLHPKTFIPHFPIQKLMDHRLMDAEGWIKPSWVCAKMDSSWSGLGKLVD